jgi:sugar phosphate isomerase/epimerase
LHAQSLVGVSATGRQWIHRELFKRLIRDIFFELDIYWIQTAGQDPAEMVKRIGKRAPLLHIKDGPCDLGKPMVAVGEGAVDVPL